MSSVLKPFVRAWIAIIRRQYAKGKISANHHEQKEQTKGFTATLKT
jgi:hypothetical protein